MIKLKDILNESTSGRSIKEIPQDELNKINKDLYDIISSWILTSLNATSERQSLGEKMNGIEIPSEYKKVPTEYLYRAKKKGAPPPTQKYVSYSYDYSGAMKMKGWLKKIFGIKDEDLEIIGKPVSSVDVLICIPVFLRLTKPSTGRKFEALWKSEKEVIVKSR